MPRPSKDLSLTPVQTGLVASVFLWVYSVLVPVGGFLGDIARRKWIVFASLMVWSVGTMLSGAATIAEGEASAPPLAYAQQLTVGGVMA